MFGTVEMDLSKYGAEGKVVVGPLTFRRSKESQNAVTRALRRNGGTELYLSDLNLGDFETITTLAYVRSAPFPTDLMDLSGFYDWTDMLDEKRLGAAQEFFDDLTEAIKKVESGEAHPLE